VGGPPPQIELIYRRTEATRAPVRRLCGWTLRPGARTPPRLTRWRGGAESCARSARRTFRPARPSTFEQAIADFAAETTPTRTSSDRLIRSRSQAACP